LRPLLLLNFWTCVWSEFFFLHLYYHLGSFPCSCGVRESVVFLVVLFYNHQKFV
jgi:hypothetical protein